MKKLLFFTILFLGILCLAQVPERMSYQAIIRDASGQLIRNQSVAVRVSVLYSGTAAYSERLTGTTNINGLLNLEIGGGTPISGTFNSINWSSGSYYLKTETDPTGGTNYTIVGTSQLLSVPYAMYAKTSGSGGTSQWTTNGNDISNSNSGNVGIGTPSPSTKLTVKSDGMGITQESPNGSVRMGFFVNNTTAFLQTHTNYDLNFATNDATDFQMKLQKGTGNLGIGKTPVEKLDVGGKTKTETLQVTTGGGLGKVLTSDGVGNGSWTQIMHKDILAISPYAFVSENNNHALSVTRAYFPTNVNSGNLISQINLPTGSIISGNITVYFLDNSVNKDYSIKLVRVGQGSTFPETLVSFNTSGAGSAIQTYPMSVTTPITIDNATYFYYFSMSGDFLNGYDGINGVKIPYSYPVNN